MSALAPRWAKLKARYGALQQRERVLVAAALILGPLMIGQSLVVDPRLAQVRRLEQSIVRQTSAMADMESQVAVLQQQAQIDPDAGRKAELAALKAERDGLDKQLQQFGSALVRPHEMNALLEGLLRKNAGLRLLSLKTLAPQSILGQKATEGDKKPVERAFDLYRHGVEIRLEGRYGELQAYLEQLEKLPQRLLWGSLSYRVVEHPRAEMILTVYTLSPERTWLAL